jgi:hypothetical protein
MKEKPPFWGGVGVLEQNLVYSRPTIFVDASLARHGAAKDAPAIQ